jgi:23S rRNA pseudouridine2605 synthase
MQIRLNKFLASAGVASRRKCDDLISAGKVKVNGEVNTKLGLQIDDEQDEVEFEGTVVYPAEKKIYVVVNKPVGFVSTVKDEHDRKTVIDLLPISERIFPVGRLDFDSTGVLLLTNDGPLSHRLTHPSYEIEKTYHVLLDKVITPKDLYHVEHGIILDDKKTHPCKALQVRVYDNCSLLSISIHEGRNRQIRRMFEMLEYEVQELDRIRFANIDLSGLKRGEWRHLTKNELSELKEIVEF